MVKTNYEITEINVDNLLNDRGLTKDCKDQAVRQMFYHLFVAIDIYRYMNVAEKNTAGYWYRKFKNTFSLRGFLKERIRRRDKGTPPCTPLIGKRAELKNK